MDNKTIRFYGRARRIAFVEKIVYFVIGVIAITVVILIISLQRDPVDDNVNFDYLRKALENSGYNCEMIHKSGGQCVLKSDNSTSNFIRYNNGFEFIERTNGFVLLFKHVSSSEDEITFKTSASAIAGYKNNNYVCHTKDNILGEFEKCVDMEENELDSNSYISIIQLALKDLNNFIDASGYDKDILISEYKWTKK